MLNHNKTYILGLFVGGGKLDKYSFIIELPFKKWGTVPSKMNVIAVDILQRIAKLFSKEYALHVSYEIGNNKWFIKPIENQDFTAIKNDLQNLGLPSAGSLLKNANLQIAKENLQGIQAESFLSGFFDARASIALSHRRFSQDAPVVSIEIPGSTQNFQLVVQLCSWLTDLGSTTDQILYNHPNQHAKADPYYRNWKKGFKIRFLIQSFLATHSFALQAKSIDATKIKKTQKKADQQACPFRKIRQPSPLSVHKDISSNTLSLETRDKLYLHYFQYCASLGCKHAPVREVKKIITEKNTLISFFPILAKGCISEMKKHFDTIVEKYFPSHSLSESQISVEEILSSKHNFTNYHGIEQGLAFLLSTDLNGKRHKGAMQKILKGHTKSLVIIYQFEYSHQEPILLINPENDRAFICSDIKSKTNQKLILERIITKDYDIKLR